MKKEFKLKGHQRNQLYRKIVIIMNSKNTTGRSRNVKIIPANTFMKGVPSCWKKISIQKGNCKKLMIKISRNLNRL